MMNEEINFYRGLAAEIKPEGFRSFFVSERNVGMAVCDYPEQFLDVDRF